MLTRKLRVNTIGRDNVFRGERVTVFYGRLGIVERDCIYGASEYYDSYEGGKIA